MVIDDDDENANANDDEDGYEHDLQNRINAVKNAHTMK
jgi:hypothetical protein